MEILNRIRSDYAHKIEFLMVDVNSQQGRSFMQQQQLNQPGLALFAPDGKRIGMLNDISDEKTLRQALNNYFTLQ